MYSGPFIYGYFSTSIPCWACRLARNSRWFGGTILIDIWHMQYSIQVLHELAGVIKDAQCSQRSFGCVSVSHFYSVNCESMVAFILVTARLESGGILVVTPWRRCIVNAL